MDLLKLGIAFLLTVVSYLIFPICYRHSNGRVCEKKGKKLALWNSIVCAIIFLILGICIGLEPSSNGTMFAPAFLYYFVSKSILIDKTLPNQEITNDKSLEKNVEHHICPHCGMQIFNDEENCSNCNANNPYFNASDNLEDEEDEINQDLEDSIIEEEPLDSVETIDTQPTIISNNKKQSSKVGLIKKLQIAVLSIVCVLVLFSIIYPISVNSICSSKIPATSEYKTIQLTRLDASQKVYCEMSGNYNYLYVKTDKGIILYRFYNATMYNNSYVRSGYATSSQLKSYFGSDIYSGKPSASFIAPATIPIGIVLGVLMLSSILVLAYLIHRYSEEEIFYLTKKDEEFISLKNDFKNEEINKYDYQKNIKELFSTKILQDNKFFKIFKFLY